MPLFTKAFWATTLELVVVAFASTFASSLVIVNPPTSQSFITAAIAGAVAALYALARQIGSVKTINAIKAAERGAHVAQFPK